MCGLAVQTCQTATGQVGAWLVKTPGVMVHTYSQLSLFPTAGGVTLPSLSPLDQS